MESDITEKKKYLLNRSEELKRIALELCEPISMDDKESFVEMIVDTIKNMNKKQKRNEVKLMNSYYRRMK